MNIVYPESGEKAYGVAANIFAEYWRKITGEPAGIVSSDHLPEGDVVLIGNDAVNKWTHKMVESRRVNRLGIRYGSDDYRLLSVSEGNRTILIVAGGCGRSTIYGVYDFFRLRGNVAYFWDGDVFHYTGPIDASNLDSLEQPHFRYRGLRYFAHRGAHRFFPEMWNLEEWKCEIDWILKRRFNLFMLRIGTDDIFQRAFDLPYPPEDTADPDDKLLEHRRTALWPLRHRSKLRAQVLEYARERGLVHPEDTGAMSHWYTPTPNSFFERFPDHPMLGDEKTAWYSRKHLAVWDVHSDTVMDRYWKLTEAHIKAFGGGQPRMFHTIGLAERLYGSSDEENLQLKLYTLRRTQEWIRRRYPDVPLIVAGWDLMMWWKRADVARLCEELDPEKTVIFDYNADQNIPATYRAAGLYGRFPWMFGMLHCFAFNNEMRGDYKLLGGRLADAARDEKCIGFLLWPELSHTDTFLLEFLAEKSWRPERLDESELIGDFCLRRYPEPLRTRWRDIWRRVLGLFRFTQWGGGEWPISAFDLEFHHRLLESDQFSALPPERAVFYRAKRDEVMAELSWWCGVLDSLIALLPDIYASAQMRRDAIDVARAMANLALRTMFMDYCVRLENWRTGRCEISEPKSVESVIRKTFTLLADLLEQNDDFSLQTAFERIKAAHPVNPDAESLIKHGASNSYCRNQTAEVVRHLYLNEMDRYFEMMNAKLDRDDRSPFDGFERKENEKGSVAGFCELPVSAQKAAIHDRFMETPLADMKFVRGATMENLRDVLAGFRDALRTWLDARETP